jgi:hypothetical protein
MRLFLVLACLMTALIATSVPKSQPMTNAPSATSSQEVQSLKNDIHALETSLQSSRNRQDGWNGWYLRLGVAALVLATLLGIASWVCQKKASGIEYSSRPTVDNLALKNARLREVLDHEAQLEVAKAQQDAFDASTRAGRAEQGAGEANERALKAQSSLAEAEEHSAEANAKAEGFRLDIAKSNQAAAQAQAQVAGAMAEAAKANLELERIRTPRSLTNAVGLSDSLKMFKGTEYVVFGCFQDQESMDFLIQLDAALTKAGWVRIKLPQQDMQITLNIAPGFAVPLTTRSGVYVVAQSTETSDSLKAIPVHLLPGYIRAAMALKGGLASGINPPEGDFGPLPLDPGNSTSVFIIVGKKP